MGLALAFISGFSVAVVSLIVVGLFLVNKKNPETFSKAINSKK